MYVYDKPYTFSNGEVLDNRDLNALWKYKKEALADAVERRYIESVFPISFTQSCAIGYTNSNSADLRTFKFTAPADLYVTRAFLDGSFSVIDGEVKVVIEDSSGSTPAGCTDPWLSIENASINTDVSDLSPARFKLSSGETYSIRVESASNFTVTRLDLIFHVLSDRYGFGAAPDPLFTYLSEVAPSNKFTQDNNDYTFAAAGQALDQAIVQSNYAPVTYSVSSVYLETTVNDQNTFPIPRIGDSRATPEIVGISLYVAADAAGASTNTYTVEILNTLGVAQDSLSVTLLNTQTAAYGFKSVSVPISTPLASGAAVTSSDFFLGVSGTSNISLANRKYFITLWIK